MSPTAGSPHLPGSAVRGVSGVARTPSVLTIAGSDSGGGAGIQADLKAFARCGVHGTSAVTAITAQNTVGVQAIHAVPPDIVIAQIRSVMADIDLDAVKIGMLGSAPTVRAVATALAELPPEIPVVLDPVMVSESGARLLDADAESALIAEILPRATVLTPNLPEASALAGALPTAAVSDYEPHQEPAFEADRASALARALLELGPQIVVLTGGHREQATDLFLDAREPDRIVGIPGRRHPDGAAHGSGCTHSSILAAQLALGRAPLQAAFAARALTGEAVAQGLRDVGQGPGPVDAIGLARVRARLGLS